MGTNSILRVDILGRELVSAAGSPWRDFSRTRSKPTRQKLLRLAQLGPTRLALGPYLHDLFGGRDYKLTDRPTVSAGQREHVYVVDKFPSYSETFVSTEMSSLSDAGTPVSVYSIHKPDANIGLLAPYIAPPLAAWRMLPWALPGIALLLSNVATGLRMDVRGVPKMIFAAAHAARLAARIRFTRPHSRSHVVLHAHFLARPTDVVALSSLWLPRSPILVTSHAGDAKDRRDPKLRRWRTSSADHILAASQYVKANLTADQADLCVSVVHCGIDLSRLPRLRPGASADKHLVVVTVARLIPTKGYDRAIGIVAELGKLAGKPVVWHVVGDGPLRQDLEDARTRLTDAGVDLVMSGALSHDSTLHIIATADLFLLPSVVTSENQNAGDGIPVAILESMALGKMVVTTRAGGIPEAVVDGSTGLVITSETDSEVARRILSLIEDELSVSKMSASAMAKINTEFKAEASAAAIQSIVAAVISDPTSRFVRNDAK